MKNNLLKSVILSVILLMGVSNAWAGAGIFYGQINLEKDGGEYIAHTDNYSTAFALGKIQNLSIKATYSKVWRNDGGDITSTTLCYKLYSSTKEFIPETSVGMGWLKNFDNSNNQEWGKEGINSNLTSNLVPGDSYTLEFWFKANGKEFSSSGNTTFWLSNSGGNYKVTFTYAPTFTITLDNQGATTPGAASVTATYNAAMPSIANNLPKKTGYDFGGYFTETNGGGTQYYYGTGTGVRNWNIASATTLYAKWKAHTYTVYFNANGGDGSMKEQPFTYDIEQALSENQFTRDGYSFAGWKDRDGKSYVDQQKVKNLTPTNGGQKTLYAQWRPNVSIEGTYHFFPGEKITLNITTPDDGVKFTYQWQKLVGSVWTDISGATATTTTYTKDEATIADAGHYRCVVSAEGYCDAIAEYDVKCLQLNVYYNDHTHAFTTPLDKVDATTAVKSVNLENRNYQYYFEITDGCENFYGFNGHIHSGWYKNVTLNAMNSTTHCGLQTTKYGTYIFTIDHSYLTDDTKSYPVVSVTYPPALQEAGKVIYWDNSVRNWTHSSNADGTNKIYYRIGHDRVVSEKQGHNDKILMTLVPGTANLYKVTTHKYDNFEVWHIANNGGWSDEGNSIYKTKTEDKWAITQAMAFETLPITSPVATVTPTTSIGNGGEERNSNCEFFNYDITEGMKTWKAQVVEPTNGTITVQYTHHDGTPVNNFTSGDRDDLAHTCLLTINATPVEGYSLATLTVNGQPFTSGEKHTLTADATIEATFTINTYTVTWKLNGGQWQEGDTEDIVNNHNYGTGVTKPDDDPSRTGYTFAGWAPAEIPTTMPAQNLEFTAQWTPTPYTVTWMLGGTEHAISTVSIENPLSTAPENPSDEALGCCADKFMGWSSQQSPSAGDIFTKDNIPSNVTTAKTYYAVFATAAQGVGTSVADFSEMGYENGTAVTDPIILGDGEGHGDATITLAKAQSSSNAPTYYEDGEAVRIYAGGTITIESSYHIKNVTFVFATGDGSNEIAANSGTYADGVWTENIEGPTNNLIFTISGSTGHRRIASITVTTNYVTQCTALDNPALSGGSVPAIAVNCGDFSTLSNSQAIVFSTMQDLTCPVTFEVIEGDFLISTARDRAAQYQSKVKVVPYKTGENRGKLKNVYVRANATDHTENFIGTIKVTSGEITEEVKISLTATVTCDKFTLTTVDHLGDETEFGTYFAGEVIDTEPTPASDDCSENYTFDGWSTSEVKYGSVAYSKVTFPYTMPNHDVTLYPVYRINDTEDYHRVTSDLGANNWAGDYLIANSDQIFADGRIGGKDDDSSIGKANVRATDFSEYIQNEVVPAQYGKTYYITLESVSGGYLLKTQDGKYNYYTNNTENGLSASESASTAGKYAINVDFISDSDIRLCLSGNALGSVFRYGCSQSGCFFRFYKECGGNPIYLYKKSPLYTTSLICEEVTASDALVTSTAGQTVKVNVMATMDNMTIARRRELTVESDHNDFAATITKTSETTYNVAVSYTPAAEQIIDGTDVANITIEVNNIPVNTFQVTGRHLPPNFVIAAKWDGHWYALPANCTSSLSSTEGLLIEVDDVDNPTRATHAPASAKYGIREVIPSRQTDHGQGVVFTERFAKDDKQFALYNGSNANIQVNAQYSNYAQTNPDKYEWIPTTSDFNEYTLTNASTGRNLGLTSGSFGAYTAASNRVYLLPATFYEPAPVQVLKWKANSVIVMYTGAEAIATTQVGNNDASEKQTLSDQKITHGIYELTTNQALTSNAGGVLKLNFGANTRVELEIPLIISGDVTASANAHDVVILENSKLTAAATKYSYKDVYVYGGAKLAIPTGTTLGVNNIILRAGSISTNGAGQEATYQYIYPQVELKGTLTSSVQNIRYEYVTDYDHWYHLALPFDGSLASIHYPYEYYGDQVKLDNKGSWQIKRYAGEIRATGNYDAWKDIETEDATSTTAGQGYIFWGAPKKITANDVYDRPTWGIQRITMSVSAPAAKTAENGNKTIAGLGSHKDVANNSGKVNDQGWNLIGNPYMVNLTGLNSESLKPGKLVEVEDAAGNWTGQWKDNEDGFRYVTIPSDHFETYTAQRMTAFTEANPMIAGRTFFIQLEDDDAGVTFSAANRASLMPQHLAAQNTEVEIETGIILSSETMQDEMNFWIKDGKTNDYEYNADYPKTPNNTNFNIYGVHINGSLSWVATGPEYAEESMPIGYQVPAAGTYTLSISETYYSDILDALYVTDHAMSPELTVDLMNAPYEFSVNQAETNNERFTVSVILKTPEDEDGGGVSTGVDNPTNDNRPYKFIYQDKMYILQNGVIYDAMGKQVQTINK